MHVLRSTYLPAYTSLIKHPYSSDPFPLSTPSPLSFKHLVSPVNSIQRETQVLDLFISLKVREDVWADDTELHLERDESFKDLFDLMQPRARLEDLLRSYGAQAGILSVSTVDANGCVVVSARCASSTSGPSTPRTPAGNFSFTGIPPPAIRTRHPVTPALTSSAFGSQNTISKSERNTPRLSFNSLSISFSPRTVGVILASRNSKRTIAEVSRGREEKLESSAKKLVKELEIWLKQG